MVVTLTEGNSTTGIHVIQVNATDKDEGDNKLITYSISGGNLGDVFQIDGDTVRYNSYVKTTTISFLTSIAKRED